MEILKIVGLGLVFILAVFSFFNKKNTDWMIEPQATSQKPRKQKVY
jgi:hypothetical protein